jgi:hypothetical protein
MPASSRSLQRQPSVPSHAPPSSIPTAISRSQASEPTRFSIGLKPGTRPGREAVGGDQVGKAKCRGRSGCSVFFRTESSKDDRSKLRAFRAPTLGTTGHKPRSPNPYRCLEFLLVLDASSALASTADSDPPQVGKVCNASFRPARYPEHQDQWEPWPGLTLPRNS